MISRVLDLIILAASCLLSFRLVTSGLYRRYRAFLLYLILSGVEYLSVIIFGADSDAYSWFWIVCQPLEWFLNAWMVLELYSLVLKDYRGLYTAGRWLLSVAVGVALLASSLTLIVPTQHTRQGHLMAYCYMAERTVYFSLVVFLVTMLGLLLRYPITLNRNTVVHSVVFSFNFVSGSVTYLLLSGMGYRMLGLASYGIRAASLAALGIWLARLNSAGERRPQRLRPAWMPGNEERLIDQLNGLNLALLRVTRD